MNKKILIIVTIFAVICFAVGFFVANSVNRQTIANLQNEVGRLGNLQGGTVENDNQLSLSADEITNLIAKADADPENTELQKNIALSLYQYSSLKQETNWLPDVARILTRVYQKKPKDYNLIVSLANIYFDISQFKKDDESLQTARGFYHRALTINPNDVEVHTDLGLSYYLADPPDNARALSEFKRSLGVNPKHEKTLQSIGYLYIADKKSRQAEDVIGELKAVNPKNEAIPDLEARLNSLKTSVNK